MPIDRLLVATDWGKRLEDRNATTWQDIVSQVRQEYDSHQIWETLRKEHQEWFETTEATHDEIAAHAYRRFEQRGRVHGHDLEDWLLAERELKVVRTDDAVV